MYTGSRVGFSLVFAFSGDNCRMAKLSNTARTISIDNWIETELILLLIALESENG